MTSTTGCRTPTAGQDDPQPTRRRRADPGGHYLRDREANRSWSW
jgi:hypothetical protein